MYIHTCHNFLFADTSEFLWSMAVRGRVLPCITSVFKATRIVPTRYWIVPTTIFEKERMGAFDVCNYDIHGFMQPGK